MRVLVLGVVALAVVTLLAGCSKSSNSDQQCLAAGCDPTYGCPDRGGCNWCICGYLGNPGPTCTLAGCPGPDGGVAERVVCTTKGDCAGGWHCAFAPGCATTGQCVQDGACLYADGPTPSGAITVCDCNGATVTVQASCGVLQPFKYYGKCE